MSDLTHGIWWPCRGSCEFSHGHWGHLLLLSLDLPVVLALSSVAPVACCPWCINTICGNPIWSPLAGSSLSSFCSNLFLNSLFLLLCSVSVLAIMKTLNFLLPWKGLGRKKACMGATVVGLLLLFSRPVMSDSFQSHELEHTRPLCPPPSPKVCPSSCLLLQWCHPAVSSYDTLFSVCPQSFSASGPFSVTQLFASGDQNNGVSVSASVLPTSIQGWFPLRLTGLILPSKGLWGVFSSTTVQRHQFFGAPPSLWSSSHNRMLWPLGRP